MAKRKNVYVYLCTYKSKYDVYSYESLTTGDRSGITAVLKGKDMTLDNDILKGKLAPTFPILRSLLC